MNDARTLALQSLINYSENNFTIDRIIDDYKDHFNDLPLRDVALSKNLIYGVLRWQAKLDWIISNYSKTPLKKLDGIILIILRLGIYQIVELDKIPVSAAVNTSVELSKKFKKSNLSGFVNGVLRNMVRRIDELKYPDVEDDPVTYIKITQSFPEWLVKRWLDEIGFDETLKTCKKVNEIPQITIRPNTLKTNRDKLSLLLKNEVENLSFTDYSDGISFTNPKKSIPELIGFKKGLFHVQDEAAQLVSEFLNPGPNDKILDACAGIGGKTAYLAQLMCNKGEILAVDNVKFKLDILKNEMNRLGISIVKTELSDLSKDTISEKFDKILVDSPCSGSGVLRRNPDTKWSLSISRITKNSKRQLKILNNVSQMLKNGGILVYAVCSTEVEENEAVIEKFLKKNSNFKLDSYKFKSMKQNELFYKEHFLKTSVCNDMDGFFAARLLKQ
ncbi:MAG: 16S rRNA (cytosine(967)-C(5))-methyltransferase RsmB [Desulfobacterales bacterium]|nr:16S rRNA (cytosine(967)-C(5))-methyltransferase RsmB [Desulfobacterales bacterium]